MVDLLINPPEAMLFLERWAPQGPWVLTSIEPDRKGIETATFRPETRDRLRDWLVAQEGRNVYFHVNPVRGDLTKKADRTDVESLAWLHVDIDPRAGEDLAAEQQRALSVLQAPPAGLPPPTVIVFSGGGYQGFWKLKEPLPLGGNLAAAEDAKRYNLQLEILYGADNCHNVDRIMRLPGTVNVPDSKKQRKGRRKAMAQLVEWHEDRVYDLRQFTPAPIVQSDDSGFAGRRVQISGNVQRLASVDDLPDKVSDRCKVVIVQGLDPDEPTKFPSRSEWLFFVCCDLIRAGVADEVIFSILTDPDFGISASVLEKGSSAERYALRQIERAHEEAIHPMLRTLNERHAVIGDIGGKCRVISEVWDHAMNRSKISIQTFDDMRNRYLNQMVQVGTDKAGNAVMRPAGKWWLEHENRRQYETLVFLPGREVEGSYNMWKGFSCEARPGDCSLFLDHVRDNICAGNLDHFRYVVGWMATAVQKPAQPGFTAIVLRGKQGTGKSFFGKIFGSLWGRHFMQVTNPDYLVGQFNAHLRDCVVLLGDEAFFAGDKKHESVLKMLITEEFLTIERKGIDAEASANYIHLIMASNDSWVVPANVDDRRFLVLDVSPGHVRDERYFQRIAAQMDAGGREALLHHLLTYDISEFQVRDVPATAALQEQKMFSLSPEQEWWFSKLRDGRLLPQLAKWDEAVLKEDLVLDYIQYTQRFGVNRRGNNTRLGHFLKKGCPEGSPRSEQQRNPVEHTDGSGKTRMINRPYFWTFPSLEVCRKHWDDNFGGPYQWPEVVDAPEEAVPF